MGFIIMLFSEISKNDENRVEKEDSLADIYSRFSALLARRTQPVMLFQMELEMHKLYDVSIRQLDSIGYRWE